MQRRPHPPLIASWVGDSPTVEAGPPPAREQSRAGVRHPGAGGAGLHAPGPLPRKPARADGNAALGARGVRSGNRGSAGCDRECAGGRKRLAYRTRGEKYPCCLRDPGGAYAHRSRCRRGGGRRQCDRVSGRGQDPLPRHYAQVRCRRRRPRSCGRCPGPRGGRDDARARRRGSAPSPDRRLCGAADDPPAERARVDRRRIGRPPVRPGDPVRPRRHGGRDRRRPGARPAAAQHAPCPRPDRTDAGVQAATWLA